MPYPNLPLRPHLPLRPLQHRQNSGRLDPGQGVHALAASRHARIALGAVEVDAWLKGGLVRAALHEVFAAQQADAAAAAGFATLVALRAIARPAGAQRLVWVRQDFLDSQVGQLHPPGLAALGLNPALLVLVRAAGVREALQAAGEAVRSGGLGAVLVELWGQSSLLDFTASRRLSLAAEATGTPVLLLRVAAHPGPSAAAPLASSAAASRWVVRALPSRVLPANAPGPPAFAAMLLRSRGQEAGITWHLDWDHERQCFQNYNGTTAQPRALVPFSANRATAGQEWRTAG